MRASCLRRVKYRRTASVQPMLAREDGASSLHHTASTEPHTQALHLHRLMQARVQPPGQPQSAPPPANSPLLSLPRTGHGPYGAHDPPTHQFIRRCQRVILPHSDRSDMVTNSRCFRISRCTSSRRTSARRRRFIICKQPREGRHGTARARLCSQAYDGTPTRASVSEGTRGGQCRRHAAPGPTCAMAFKIGRSCRAGGMSTRRTTPMVSSRRPTDLLFIRATLRARFKFRCRVAIILSFYEAQENHPLR
jgi:hypothetical protein